MTSLMSLDYVGDSDLGCDQIDYVNCLNEFGFENFTFYYWHRANYTYDLFNEYVYQGNYIDVPINLFLVDYLIIAFYYWCKDDYVCLLDSIKDRDYVSFVDNVLFRRLFVLRELRVRCV